MRTLRARQLPLAMGWHHRRSSAPRAILVEACCTRLCAITSRRSELGACHARWQGFDLHAWLLVPAGDLDRLERVCRYTLRPPVTDERLRLGSDGQVVLPLRHPWADGTTSLVFEPTAFLERLAVLVPRPRINLVLYHGVLAPRAAWRAEVVRREAQVIYRVEGALNEVNPHLRNVPMHICRRARPSGTGCVGLVPGVARARTDSALQATGHEDARGGRTRGRHGNAGGRVL